MDPVAEPGRRAQYDVQALADPGGGAGHARERITNDSEQDITNALIKVTRDGKKTVCFVEGEGERDIDDRGERGYSGAKAALAKSQYETKKVLLLREGTVPADCTVVVVAGPEKDLAARRSWPRCATT